MYIYIYIYIYMLYIYTHTYERRESASPRRQGAVACRGPNPLAPIFRREYMNIMSMFEQ